ncbi:MAG: glutamate mutase L [Clostridiales bacterium]|nr:glutamate mutase L [Clostridiales bacterium]
MNAYLLIDFGSTFTKVCAVDLDSETILGTAQAPTTIESDITFGLEKAFFALEELTGHINYSKKLACSSAAGGLTVMASGLVESLTLKAAQMVALGAGAKITKSFHHHLTKSDIELIEQDIPDIFLLCGGTDGGNSDVILHNALAIAKIKSSLTVVFAGNRTIADEVVSILENSGKDVFACPNIMPSIDKLNIEPVNEVIRNLFISRITDAKGLKKAEKFVDGILMPTPFAVLSAAHLLADGTDTQSGIGELIIIDSGGATTDVHSVCDGYGSCDDVAFSRIAEPRVKRTVEGDMGVRHNAKSILDTIKINGEDSIFTREKDYINSLLKEIKNQPSILFKGKAKAFDTELCKAAVNTAVKRHCGTLERHYTPRGLRYLQYGKNFSEVKTIIGTGGPLLYDQNHSEILKESFYKLDEPDVLRPKDPNIYLDKKYILYAMGLLSTVNAEKAFRILKKELIEAGAVK